MTGRIKHLRDLFFADEHKKYRVEDLGLSILNEETEALPFAIRKAMAFDCAVEHMPIFLFEGDLICGGKTVYKLPHLHHRRGDPLGKPQPGMRRLQQPPRQQLQPGPG